jgi:uncharacterized protein (DUF1800 family)
MNSQGIASGKQGTARVLAIILTAVLMLANISSLTTHAQGTRAKHKQGELSDDRRIEHVLTRLTFGPRPGDLARVKAIGVEQFIAQQLDPDTIDDHLLDAKLGKLPTLALATPTLIEQYTPPKVVASPSPSPAPTPVSPRPAASSEAVVTLPSLAAQKSDSGTKMDESKPALVMSDQNSQKPATEEMKKPADAAAQKPTTPAPQAPKPPEKNPQRVVTELQRAALLRAVYSDRQLYESMVNFWENHFSIFANKDADRFLMTGFDRDTIRPFALGRFRDLLGATAHSPAMLYYLDNWQSSLQRNYPATKDKPARSSGGINENYARELMELHTLGVDGGYTQKDVQEVARCFSGWTIRKPNEEGLFFFNPAAHDNGEKIVLGHTIPAGGGVSDGERVLDILAASPATARFVATKLARRFVDDNPPSAVIDRAAATFLKTDGSIRETLRAIVTSPEFFAPAAYRAKVRTPFEYVAASLRALNAESDADPAVIDWTRRMGQQVFGRLTPDGYPDRAEQWLSPGAMVERFNFANALATNRIKGTRIDLAALLKGNETNDLEALTDHLTTALTAGNLSPTTRNALTQATKSEGTLCGPNVNVLGINYAEQKKEGAPPAASPCLAELITMLIGSPEFQRR